MIQPNPAIDLTDMGRSRASVEALDRRRFSRRFRRGKKRAADPIPDAQRTITPKEFNRLKKKHEYELNQRHEREQIRLRRLLFLFKGRREQVLRAFGRTGATNDYTTAEDEALAYQRRATRVLAGQPEFIAQGPIPDLEKTAPYVFSFELWLLEERCGWRERILGALEWPRVFTWWLGLTWREQLDEMLLRRDKR